MKHWPIKRMTLAFTLTSVAVTVGCSTYPALSPRLRPVRWGNLIKAEHNFYQVSPDLFRSEQPSSELVSELEQFHIQTVINLRSKNDNAQIFGANQFNLVHIPIHTWKINRLDLLQVMQEIQKAKSRHEKVLLHCYHGSDRTGASIAMYRIIFEHWTIEEAVQEMKQGGYGYHRIWVNIEKLFTPENVEWIRNNISNPNLISP